MDNIVAVVVFGCCREWWDIVFLCICARHSYIREREREKKKTQTRTHYKIELVQFCQCGSHFSPLEPIGSSPNSCCSQPSAENFVHHQQQQALSKTDMRKRIWFIVCMCTWADWYINGAGFHHHHHRRHGSTTRWQQTRCDKQTNNQSNGCNFILAKKKSN